MYKNTTEADYAQNFTYVDKFLEFTITKYMWGIFFLSIKISFHPQRGLHLQLPEIAHKIYFIRLPAV
jgi:hypothetical protein